MALGLIGVLDLSIITDMLIDKLTECRDNSPLWNPQGLPVSPGPSFTIHINGAAPDSVRKDGGCQLSIYLFHISQDKFQRNAPPGGGRVPPPGGQMPARLQPLALDLYYLVTAFADKEFRQEQQAMSIALRCLHENPIIKKNIMIAGQTVAEEFTITTEVESTDELSRLWQAVTGALRLSAVFKVSVVFMPPELPEVSTAPPVKEISLGADPASAGPTGLPFAAAGQVIGTLRQLRYRTPKSTAAKPDFASFDLSPATVAPGQRVVLYGAGLNQDQPDANTSRRVYLVAADGTEQEVTAWKAPDPNPAQKNVLQTPGRVTLDLPAAIGALPANSPAPGIYQLRVGSNIAAGDTLDYRSNGTPVSIAPRIDGVANPPILAAGGTLTVNGAGFAGQAEVLLGTVTLQSTGGALGPGKFKVNGPGTTLTFQAPANLATGLHALRVRVNGVEADPSWWVQVP
jgi:hypothetical protein